MPKPDPASAVARPPLNRAQANAIKAWAECKATPHQQKLVLEYVLHELSAVDGLSFRPDDRGGERETNFAEGRRFVGLQIRRIVLQPMADLVPKGSNDVAEN